jgi:hypothetical protein
VCSSLMEPNFNDLVIFFVSYGLGSCSIALAETESQLVSLCCSSFLN